MIVVVADDITGAAEMAGIAFDYGLRVRLVLGLDDGLPEGDVVVVATDTRSLPVARAVAETEAVVSRLCALCPELGRQSGPVLFKKTDSALRGHVVEELAAILSCSPYSRAVFLPANPSKGRVIRQGTCYCDGVPISQTDFARDPEFPALTDSMEARFPAAAGLGIAMPDAASAEEVAEVVADCRHDILLAGAADLFEALLRRRGHSAKACRAPMRLSAKDLIVVCGSTQSKPLDIGVPVAMMPRDVYDGVWDAVEWIRELLPAYRLSHQEILSVPFRHLTGRDVAVRLRQTMATVVGALVEEHTPEMLVIEGGATAYCCLETLSWRHFSLAEVYAPGVIRMTTPQGVGIILKPGSYPWPDSLKEKTTREIG